MKFMMPINRHNYEEFFILYLDNELSSEDRSRVELFAEQHPDLGEELAMLQQMKLAPDSTVVFNGKESLMKSAATDFITNDNYDEWLVLYVDNELTPKQRKAVETFAAADPSVQKEFELLQKTKLPEESIVFPNKESLYRTEKPVRRIVAIVWWRVAAAILLLIGLTIGGVSIYRNGNKVEPERMATKNPNPATKVPTVNSSKDNAIEIAKSSNENPESLDPKNNETLVNDVVEKRNNNSKEKITVRNDEPEIALNNEVRNENNLPNGSRNPNMPEKIETEKPLIAFNSPDKESLTNLKENNVPADVTPEFAKTSQSVIDEPELPGKKTKFRGILRKITRTFEKTTNMKATDADDRLLVAGLAIKL